MHDLFFYQILLPVLHGEDWIIYCTVEEPSGNYVSFRVREPSAEKRVEQRKAIVKALQDAFHKKYARKKMLSAARDVICAEYEGLISTSDKVGLLAMQFLENFSGMSFMVSILALTRILTYY